MSNSVAVDLAPVACPLNRPHEVFWWVLVKNQGWRSDCAQGGRWNNRRDIGKALEHFAKKERSQIPVGLSVAFPAWSGPRRTEAIVRGELTLPE